ncbi:hypothetical protein MRX96_034457 [Rhipicephalus microplus]
MAAGVVPAVASGAARTAARPDPRPVSKSISSSRALLGECAQRVRALPTDKGRRGGHAHSPAALVGAEAVEPPGDAVCLALRGAPRTPADTPCPFSSPARAPGNLLAAGGPRTLPAPGASKPSLRHTASNWLPPETSAPILLFLFSMTTLSVRQGAKRPLLHFIRSLLSLRAPRSERRAGCSLGELVPLE